MDIILTVSHLLETASASSTSSFVENEQILWIGLTEQIEYMILQVKKEGADFSNVRKYK